MGRRTVHLMYNQKRMTLSARQHVFLDSGLVDEILAILLVGKVAATKLATGAGLAGVNQASTSTEPFLPPCQPQGARLDQTLGPERLSFVCVH